MFRCGLAFGTVIFDMEAMIGPNFSRRVVLWVSQELRRTGMEVGSKKLENTLVLMMWRKKWLAGSWNWLEIDTNKVSEAQHLPELYRNSFSIRWNGCEAHSTTKNESY